MAKTMKLRDYLSSKSILDCDTLNADVPVTLGPFQDCTSNQAILFAELSLGKHHDLISRHIQIAKNIAPSFPSVSIEELSLDLCAVAVQQLIASNISGYVHLQVNPFHSYDTDKIVENAQRFISLCSHITPNLDPKRLCIKIPSTWEGISACRILEASGIRTLATTLFSMEQAALAGEAGCLYIAPYVLELKVHFNPGYADPAPAIPLCKAAQTYFRQRNLPTTVLAASLQRVDELLQLASFGCGHITISPGLLELVRDAPDLDVDEKNEPSGSGGSGVDLDLDLDLDLNQKRWGGDWLLNEGKWRMAFTRREGGRAETKQVEAINIFCNFQEKLEQLIRERL